MVLDVLYQLFYGRVIKIYDNDSMLFNELSLKRYKVIEATFQCITHDISVTLCLAEHCLINAVQQIIIQDTTYKDTVGWSHLTLTVPITTIDALRHFETG